MRLDLGNNPENRLSVKTRLQMQLCCYHTMPAWRVVVCCAWCLFPTQHTRGTIFNCSCSACGPYCVWAISYWRVACKTQEDAGRHHITPAAYRCSIAANVNEPLRRQNATAHGTGLFVHCKPACNNVDKTLSEADRWQSDADATNHARKKKTEGILIILQLVSEANAEPIVKWYTGLDVAWGI